MDIVKRPVNLRDLGGYLGKDGKRVKSLSLLRSGEITNISDDDKKILVNEYKLKTIVDFRSESEKENAPDSIITNVDYFHIDIMKDDMGKNTSLENFQKNMNEEYISKFMEETYRDFIIDKGAVEGYREFMKLLMNQEGGSLIFHCFAGKDRTGFGAALILTLLGVSKKDIYHDYMLTNKMRAEENLKMINKMKDYGMTEEQVKVMDIALNVEKNYLDASYKTAEENFGSLDNYITEAIKVDKEDRKFLLEKYLI